MHNAIRGSQDNMNSQMPFQHNRPRARIMFYCQSSLGVGHTMRSLRLVNGMSGVFDICFLNGGEVITQLEYPRDINIVTLPPIKTDPEFSQLQSVDEELSVETVMEKRRDIMLKTYSQFRPDVLIIELYPFGRNSFSPELKPLLTTARNNGVKIVCSLRDILVSKRDKTAYEQKVVKRMNRFFDTLLIHGDPDFLPLDNTFSRLSDIQANIFYTGYVTPEPEMSNQSDVLAASSDTIIASIGGGRFGHELAEAVVRSAPVLKNRIPHKIKLYTGPFCPGEVTSFLRRLAHGQSNLRVEVFTENLHRQLHSADLSISMGGYNTTMDVLSSGVRALMMPCLNSGGMDQTLRLNKLAQNGVIELINASDLEPDRFAEKIVSSLEKEKPQSHFNLNGVSTTRAIITQLINS